MWSTFWSQYCAASHILVEHHHTMESSAHLRISMVPGLTEFDWPLQRTHFGHQRKQGVNFLAPCLSGARRKPGDEQSPHLERASWNPPSGIAGQPSPGVPYR
jgi:hypothetical protein